MAALGVATRTTVSAKAGPQASFGWPGPAFARPGQSWQTRGTMRSMATGQDVIAAVVAGDAARITEFVTLDPDLATARDEHGVSALMLSRYRADRATTDALMAADPDLDIFEAAALGYLDRLRGRLDDDPASATAYAADGFTALHFAAFFGKLEAARTLIDAGADVGAVARNAQRVQPIHSAAANRHHEICRLLVASGADVDARQEGGFAPMHAAAQHGDSELVELFLSAGADPLAATDQGETAADRAEAAGHADVARRLREIAAERGG